MVMTPVTPEQAKLAKKLLDSVGSVIPDQKRIKGSMTTSVKLVPTGENCMNVVLDSFQRSNAVSTQNKLAGKRLVLIFGCEKHTMFRTFLMPKLACIYHYMTLKESDIEFLYVSLPEEGQAEYGRFIKSHPWPCVPWEEQDTRRQLTDIFHTPLKKPYGGPSVVVLDSDHETVINRDAEPYIIRTHNEKGTDYPWKVSAAANACAAVSICFCTII